MQERFKLGVMKWWGVVSTFCHVRGFSGVPERGGEERLIIRLAGVLREEVLGSGVV
jgi:hypothetical protein